MGHILRVAEKLGIKHAPFGAKSGSSANQL